MRKTAEATGIQFTLLRGVDAAAVNRHINTGEGRWHTFAVIALTYPEGCQVSKQLINIA
jgi:hypothetical protein